MIISDLRAGVINIQRSIGYCHQHRFNDFVEFMQVLEAYGCGYTDDIDSRNYKLRDKQSHRQAAIKNLSDIQKMFEIAIK